MLSQAATARPVAQRIASHARLPTHVPPAIQDISKILHHYASSVQLAVLHVLRALTAPCVGQAIRFRVINALPIALLTVLHARTLLPAQVATRAIT